MTATRTKGEFAAIVPMAALRKQPSRSSWSKFGRNVGMLISRLQFCFATHIVLGFLPKLTCKHHIEMWTATILKDCDFLIIVFPHVSLTIL
jgi:hypothetical protein